MKKSISFLFLGLTFAFIAAVVPNSNASSIDENFAGASHHVGFGRFHPSPSRVHTQEDFGGDSRFGAFSVLAFGRSQKHQNDSDLHVGDVTICLSDLQAFLASQHINSFSLKDLKSWLGQLDPVTLSNLESCLQQQIIDYGAIGTDESDWTGSNVANGLTVADQAATAVPEPSNYTHWYVGWGC
jgi:hypothetical protein